MKKAEYLKFEEIDSSWLKTQRWAVITLRSGTFLGMIGWYSQWRQYVFYPDAQTQFNADCLGQISRFMQAQTQERRLKIKKAVGS